MLKSSAAKKTVRRKSMPIPQIPSRSLIKIINALLYPSVAKTVAAAFIFGRTLMETGTKVVAMNILVHRSNEGVYILARSFGAGHRAGASHAYRSQASSSPDRKKFGA